MKSSLIESLVREILSELIQKTDPKSLSYTIANFLRTKHGSGLSGMERPVFIKLISSAVNDLVRAKGLQFSDDIKNQIVKMAIQDLSQTGEAPQVRRAVGITKATPPQKQSLLGRLFGK